MLQQLLDELDERMNKGIDSLRREFASFRTGRANPGILDRVTVDYYGTATPINQLANISVPESRLLVIQPWDKSTIGLIEKAILGSDLGLNPTNDGTLIRLAIPQLTEERRKEMVKTCHKKAEETKVALRNIRRDVNDDIKALEKSKEITEDDAKRAMDDVQKTTDKFIQKADEVLAQKEKDIMEV